jgi:hypothetical protein
VNAICDGEGLVCPESGLDEHKREGILKWGKVKT